MRRATCTTCRDLREGVVSVQDLGGAVRRVSLGLGAGSAGARCLRGARRQDRAHGRARAAACASWWRSTSTRSVSTRVRENLERGRSATPSSSAAMRRSPRRWWDGVPFDRILLDAPCSALGVIRRHPDIRLRKSPSEIDKLPALQARLLHAAWRMLAPRRPPGVCHLHRDAQRKSRPDRGVSAQHPRRRQSLPAEELGGLAGFRRGGRIRPANSSRVRRVPTASIMLP